MRTRRQKRILRSLRRYSVSWWIVSKHPLCLQTPALCRARHRSSCLTGLWPKVWWSNLRSYVSSWASHYKPTSQSITVLKCCELYKLCFIWDLQSCLPPRAGYAGLANEASESSCQLFEKAEVDGRGCECPIFPLKPAAEEAAAVTVHILEIWKFIHELDIPSLGDTWKQIR